MHKYGYYNIVPRPVNLQVQKILVPVICEYTFIIFISYPLQVLSVDTCLYEFFGHLYPTDAE